MKVAITFIVCMIVSLTVWAQQDSMVVVFEYCYLDPLEELGSKQIQAEIDTGETDKAVRMKDPTTGKPMKFKSVVDLLNYMGKQGWELVSVNAGSASSMFNNYSFGDHRYILKRRIMKKVFKID